MAAGDQISCAQFAQYLVSQEPVYDELILADVRPTDAGLMGFYQTGSFDAYSGTQHTFDRVNAVYPNTTTAWRDVNGSNCITPSACDPESNKIGMGWTRTVYGLQEQSWESELFCFDQIMYKTRAKDSFRQYITGILSPATRHIMNDFLMKEALANASKVISVTTGLPEVTFTWEGSTAGSEGYVYLNVVGGDPTGKLTAPVLQTYVDPLIAVGGAQATEGGITGLQLHTDKDSFYDMVQGNPTLNINYRIQTGEFAMSAKEYYKYGMRGFIGDYLVKVLMFPLRFNRVSAGRFQVVLPYKNIAATEGIKSVFNEDYQNAQYQISYINNPAALRVLAFRPESVNQEMPFMIRDYGGRWKFVNNDLGSDCNGKAINNSRGNKGKFIADFRLAVKPERPEWLYAIFHKRSKPCVTIETVCAQNPDPGYPAQDYASVNAGCTSTFRFTAIKNGANFVIAANTITCNGNPITHTAISVATLALVVSGLTSVVPELGTWEVYSTDTNQFQLTGSSCEDVNVPFTLP